MNTLPPNRPYELIILSPHLIRLLTDFAIKQASDRQAQPEITDLWT
ncbi:hypothetical protein [Nostoc sp.]